MIDAKRLDVLTKRCALFSWVLLMFAMIFVIAHQQKEIVILKDQAGKHDEFIHFMQQGERFTFEDGKALFLICTKDQNVPESIKQEVWSLYGESETSFSSWLRMQDVCKSK